MLVDDYLASMNIKDMATRDRPRERLEDCGPQSLSTAELMAILVRTGIKGESALDLSQRVLGECSGSLVQLSSMSLDKIREIRGMGGSKALPLIAAFELGRRFFAEGSQTKKCPIISPVQVYNLLKPLMKGLDHEELWVLYLNNARYVVGKCKASVGGLGSTVIDIPSIVRTALDKKASSIIVSHNHPSGNPRPGQEDMKATEMLTKALKPFSISLLDHVVVSDGCYYSFADEMLYQENYSRAP